MSALAPMVSDEGIAFVEKLLRQRAREEARAPKAAPKRETHVREQVRTEIEQLRMLMKPGTPDTGGDRPGAGRTAGA